MKKIIFILIIILSFCSVNVKAEDVFYKGGYFVVDLPNDDLDLSALHVYRNMTDLGIRPLYYQSGQNRIVYFFISSDFEDGDYELYSGNSSIKKFKINGTADLGIDKIFKTLKSSDNIVTFVLDNYAEFDLEVSVESSESAVEPARDKIIIGPLDKKNLFVFYFYNNLSKMSRLVLTTNNNKSYVVYLFKEGGDVVKNDTAVEVPEEKPVEKVKFSKPDFKGAIASLNNVSSIDREVFVNQVVEGVLKFKNVKENELHNIVISLSPELGAISDLDKYQVDILRPFEQLKLNLTVNRFKNVEPGDYDGILSLTCDEGCLTKIPIHLKFYRYDSVELNSSENFVVENQSSENNDLEILPLNLSNSGSDQKEKSSSAKSIVIAFLLILSVLIVVIYAGYKLQPKPIEPKKFRTYLQKIKR